MRYLLDTNVCIAFMNGKKPNVTAKFKAISPAEIGLCSIVKAECFTARKTANFPQKICKPWHPL